MISLDLKNDTASSASTSSLLGLSASGEEPTLSFSDFLRGVSEKKDSKDIQNGSLILALVDDKKNDKDLKSTSKGDSLLSLLKNENTSLSVKTAGEPLELNPKVVANLTISEIKELVARAKNYLKAKIQDSDDFKKATIKELPKTLKGLAEVAKKFGIDISKISIEEVRANVKTKSELQIKDVKILNIKDDDKNLQKEAKVEASTLKDLIQDKKVVVSDIKEVVQEKKEATKEVVQEKKEATKEVVQEKKEATKEVIPDKKEAIKEIVQDKKVQSTHIVEKETISKATPVSQKEQMQEVKNDVQFVKTQKEVKETPLFKAQATKEHAITEQIVQAKVNNPVKVVQKTSKDKADETLKLLLRGEKSSFKNSALTADFSVATAKVIAPTATTNISKSLEALLHGDLSQNDNNTAGKVDGLTTYKADSFEVKLNEAKQMIKYLSNDVKSAIEDYKSPFTRIKIQLNPQKLGEVDLTIVQRGKNLHVNISSNNVAINALAANVNELRTQLSNSGINNASLNFNNSSQNSDTNAGHQNQQYRQNEKDAHEKYNYFENEELNEEILSSLEIVVPYYA
ncbi:MAG: flagellar hook-length control protein FliK [Sulfurimonas sp.]|nr:flagellar hook-length control protein FliK [Sulfurimonas sp.]